MMMLSREKSRMRRSRNKRRRMMRSRNQRRMRRRMRKMRKVLPSEVVKAMMEIRVTVLPSQKWKEMLSRNTRRMMRNSNKRRAKDEITDVEEQIKKDKGFMKDTE